MTKEIIALFLWQTETGTDRGEGTCDKPTQNHLTGNICTPIHILPCVRSEAAISG
ncbi:MAG: hypothetical protein ABJA66_15060 [Actinomycetota bacterium]